MRLLVLLVGTTLLLGGCAERIDSLCSRSGGDCCSINYAYDQKGNPSAKVMTCRRSADICLAAAKEYGGTPQYPYKPDVGNEKGECEMKTKWVPFWDPDYLTAFRIAAIRHKGPLPPEIRAADGSTTKKGDVDYCKQACLTGDGGLCPIVPLPEDIALGMLSTVVDSIEGATATPKIITVAEVLAKFRLPASANSCGRGDLITSTAAILNSAPGECRTDITQATSVGNVPVVLTMPTLLVATPIQSKNIAHWKNASESFMLDVTDPSLKGFYSGPIEAAGRTDVTRISTQVKGSTDIGCAEITPIVDLRYDISSLSKVVEEENTAVTETLRSLSSYRSELRSRLPADKRHEVDDIVITGSLFPYETYVKALQRTGERHSIQNVAPVPIRTAKGAVPFEKMLRLIDVHVCSEAKRSTSLSDLIPLVPELRDPGARQQLAERAEIAGSIIQCKLSSEKITARARAILRRDVQ